MNKLFAYPGGKWPIRNLIVSCFPEHRTYVDVFGGSAAILVTKEPSAGEVFNDKNEQIVNFFRVVKHRPAELAERSRHWIHSRVSFDEAKSQPLPSDEIEKAFRFWVVLSDSFGARGLNYGMAREGMHSVTHARAHLNLVADRLKGVHVECMDFRQCIRTYDSATTFFYLDPPYPDTHGGDTNYDMLAEEDWAELKEMLAGIKGKFLLSSNDHPMVRRLFRGFPVREISVRATLSRQKTRSMRREILVSNYRLSVKNRDRRSDAAGDAAPMRHPNHHGKKGLRSPSGEKS